jgi:hypothetical protein
MAPQRLHDVLDNLADLAAVIAGPRLEQPVDPDDPLAETWRQQVERRLHAIEEQLRDLLPAGEENPSTETQAQQFERRLHAVEVHLQHLPPERGA